jgi:hypothetical protein
MINTGDLFYDFPPARTRSIDQDSGLRYSVLMKWDVSLKDSVRDDLRWFGKKDGRLILQAALQLLTEEPLAQTKNMKTLRPNAFAQRELRLLGKIPVAVRC